MKFCVCHYKAKRRDIQYLVRISPGPAKNCRLPVCFPCIFAKLFYFHVNDTEEKQMDKLDAGRLKAAVFDWDGTLAETRTPRLWAVNRIMAKYPRKAEQAIVFHGQFPAGVRQPGGRGLP